MFFVSCPFSSLIRSYPWFQIYCDDSSLGSVVMKYVNQPDTGLYFQTSRQVSEQKVIWNLSSLSNFNIACPSAWPWNLLSFMHHSILQITAFIFPLLAKAVLEENSWYCVLCTWDFWLCLKRSPEVVRIITVGHRADVGRMRRPAEAGIAASKRRAEWLEPGKREEVPALCWVMKGLPQGTGQTHTESGRRAEVWNSSLGCNLRKGMPKFGM